VRNSVAVAVKAGSGARTHDDRNEDENDGGEPGDAGDLAKALPTRQRQNWVQG
jgi:hypothetical protein